MKIKTTISTKFITIAALSIAIAAIGTGSISYTITRTSLIAKLTESDLVNIVSLKSGQIDNRIHRAADTSLVLANNQALVSWLKSSERSEQMGSIAKNMLTSTKAIGDYSTCFAASKITENYWKENGELHDKVTKGEARNDWFWKYVGSGKKVSADIGHSKDRKRTYVFISALVGELDNPIGVCGVGVNVTEMAAAFAKTDKYDGKSYMIDRKGVITMAEDISLVEKPISSVLGEDLQAKILSANDKTTVYSGTTKRGLCFVAQAPVPNAEWIGVYEVPRFKMTKVLIFIGISTIISAFLAIGLVIVIFYIASRPIILSIKSIGSGFDALSKGDLNTKVEVTSTDEVGDMSAQFNVFSEHLRTVITKVKEISLDVAAAAEEMSSSTDEFSANIKLQLTSSEDISSAITQISAGEDSVATMAAVQNQSMGGLKKSITELTELVNQMGEITAETIKKAETMSKSAQNGETAVRSMNTSMEKIIESSKDMLSITAIINDISDKINLLSLNAAIEAARAGEFGRGFAVVADEIAKLAEQTSESTNQISKIIKENTEEIARGKHGVEDSISATTEILSGVATITEMMSHIVTNMQRQIESNRAVTSEAEKVLVKSEEIRMATGEQKQAASAIVSSVSQVNGLMNQNTMRAADIASSATILAELAENMKEKVDFFKI